MVSEQPVLVSSLEAADGGPPRVVAIYQSRIGYFDDTPEIALDTDHLLEFRPTFEDETLSGMQPGHEVYHRIVDVHPTGAVLFHTNLVTQNSAGFVEVQDAGFFIQRDPLSIALPVPEERVLGFTKDPGRLILSYLNEAHRVKLLLCNGSNGKFSRITFGDGVTDFLGGEVFGRYICMREAEGPDGEELPYLVDTTGGKSFPLKEFSCFGDFTPEGLVVGNVRREAILEAPYFHVSGGKGLLVLEPQQAELQGLSSLPAGATKLSETTETFFVVTGSLASTTLRKDPLDGISISATPQRALCWFPSSVELREGAPIEGSGIEERIVDGNRNFSKLTMPTPDLRMVGVGSGDAENQEFLLVPIR